MHTARPAIIWCLFHLLFFLQTSTTSKTHFKQLEVCKAACSTAIYSVNILTHVFAASSAWMIVTVHVAVRMKHSLQQTCTSKCERTSRPATRNTGFSCYTGKPKLVCLERAETLFASFLALGDDSQNIESYCLGQRSAQ